MESSYPVNTVVSIFTSGWNRSLPPPCHLQHPSRCMWPAPGSGLAMESKAKGGDLPSSPRWATNLRCDPEQSTFPGPQSSHLQNDTAGTNQCKGDEPSAVARPRSSADLSWPLTLPSLTLKLRSHA